MSDDSDSSLSSAASEAEVQKLAPIFQTAKKATKQRFPPPAASPPRPKRAPSPPREAVFADNADIALIVMFRARFNETLPPKLPQLGPQDVERGVVEQPPSAQVEGLLCALLGLVLNRKKPVERGHHGRALEEAVLSQKTQWPLSWRGVNPLHGSRDFNTMAPTERLNLLRTLIMWAFTSSDAITALVKDRYKQSRHQDDENQPLSVQPWGTDGDKRRYFLVQGLEDTSFRVYREGSRYTKNAHWISVAGDIDELRVLATKLEGVDGTQAARRLAGKIGNALPTFLASEEKRQKREARQLRTAAFKARPQPGFSLYEGRTRGKRLRYTYDDDDSEADDGGLTSDATSGARRSTRNQSTRNTPSEQGPLYTASGRLVSRPRTGEYGESLLGKGVESLTDELGDEWEGEVGGEVVGNGRAGRAGARAAAEKRKRGGGYEEEVEDEDEEEEGSEGNDLLVSGDEWDSEANEQGMPEARAQESEEQSEGDAEQDAQPRSLVVTLRVPARSRLCLSSNNGAAGVVAVSDEQSPRRSLDAPASNGAATANGYAEPPRDDRAHASNDVAAAKTAAKTTGDTRFANSNVDIAHGDVGNVTAEGRAGTSLGSTPPAGAEAYPTPASASCPAQAALVAGGGAVEGGGGGAE
ncbi:hypothetical protein LTR08_002136 [Meristemomyces frigidus]|nr:hypothetical protein LTR08_002136 [Meristemomyces frigidus]